MVHCSSMATAGHLRRVPLPAAPSKADVVFPSLYWCLPIRERSTQLWTLAASARSEYLALDPVGGIPQFIRLARLSACVIGIVLLIAFAVWIGIVEASVGRPFWA